MKNEIIIYKPDDLSKVEVVIEDETLWLTQAQIVVLYESSKANISEHIKHIFQTGELNKISLVRKFRTTASDGKQYNVMHYSLDVVISIGHRVNSIRVRRFHNWANNILTRQINRNEHEPLIYSKIYNLIGEAIMLDKDLADFYQTETRILKQAVKRNIERFPSDFMFELKDNDIEFMVSQSVIPSAKHFGGAMPYAFTEQGVSTLSAILKTPIAVEISLKIIRAFVELKNLTLSHYNTQKRLKDIEIKQVETDRKITQLFEAIDDKSTIPNQGVFFDGQVFDAYTLMANLVRKAKKQIILIDNYVDDSVLTLFSKKRKEVCCAIFTKNINRQLKQDAEKFNQQYGKLTLHKFDKAHDRFLIIDYNANTEHCHSEVYHIGASIKDLSKKWFAFTMMDKSTVAQLLKLISELL